MCTLKWIEFELECGVVPHEFLTKVEASCKVLPQRVPYLILGVKRMLVLPRGLIPLQTIFVSCTKFLFVFIYFNIEICIILLINEKLVK